MASLLTSKPGRKSGGEPGNKNALKHGFYSKASTAEEIQALASHPGMQAEQELLRTRIRRLAKLTRLTKITPRQLQALDILLRAVKTMETLERTLLLGRGKGGALGDTILETLAAMDPDDL